MRKRKKLFNKWEALKDTDEPILAVPTATQDLIPISTVTEDGTFEIEKGNGKGKPSKPHLYDRLYQFSDINFTTKDNEEQEQLLLKYCTILNSLNVNCKFIIANLTRDWLDLQDVYIRREGQSAIEEDFSNTYNSMIDDKLDNESCYIDQNKYLLVTTRKETYAEAKNYFDQMELQLSNEFQALGSDLRQVTGIERLNILYRAFRVDPELKFASSWDTILEEEFKDQIAPLELHLIDHDHGRRQYLQIDDKYASTLVIRKNGYPAQLTAKFIKEITSLPYPSIITEDIVPIPPDVLQETLVKKLDSVEAKIARQQDVRNKNEQYSSDITRAVKKEKQNIEQYLDDATEADQNMFFLQLLVTVYADTIEELDSRVDSIRQIGRSSLIDLVPYSVQQMEAFLTSLPVGGRYVNTMCRPVFTDALISFVPFNVQELYHQGGKFYGTNILSKKLVVGDRRKLLNGNGWIFGVPGAGKSFAAKLESGQVLAGSMDDVIIVDPQNENQGYVEAFDGQYIDLSAISDHHINPLEIDHRAVRQNFNDFITTKAEFVFDIISVMAGQSLDFIQRSCVDKATRKMYFEILNRPEREWISPTFSDLQKNLLALETEEADLLAAGLYAFTEGSLNLFAHQTNVELDNRFIAFGTKHLGKELTKVSMLIMLEFIRSRLNYNQSIKKDTWVYVDEAHELTEEEFTAKALERSFKEVRKQGGRITGITQNVTDCLRNKTTRTMIANSEFMLLLDQADVDLEPLLGVINVSRKELQYVQSGKKGRGLLRFGKTIVPVDNYVENKASRLYELFNTDIHEKRIKERLA